jgi:hypothetical protein
MDDIWTAEKVPSGSSANPFAAAHLDRALLVEMERGECDPADITLSAPENIVDFDFENFFVDAGRFILM